MSVCTAKAMPAPTVEIVLQTMATQRSLGMTAVGSSRRSSRARLRLRRRICHPELWSEAELQRLDRLYDRDPKRWWHVHRVVRQQVQVGHRAVQLGLYLLVLAFHKARKLLESF